MKGIFFAIMAGLIFAGTNLLDKIALSKYGASPLLGVFIRNSVSLLLVGIAVWLTGKLTVKSLNMKEFFWPLIFSGIGYSVAIYCLFRAFTYLPAGQSVAILYTVSFIVTMLLSVMFLNEYLSWVKVVGAFFCIIGIVLVAK